MSENPTTSKLAAYLRERHPYHTAKLVAADLACTVKAAESLLAGHLSGRTLDRLISVYGVDVLRALRGLENSEHRCGLCRFWEIRNSSGDHEYGVGGHHCNGTVSNCRRRSPAGLEPTAHLSGSAQWPTTKRADWCGDFERRAP